MTLLIKYKTGYHSNAITLIFLYTKYFLFLWLHKLVSHLTEDEQTCNTNAIVMSKTE